MIAAHSPADLPTAVSRCRFGTAGCTDRALGGIATSFITNSYVAMRFVNNTGRPIANLEVSYANAR